MSRGKRFESARRLLPYSSDKAVSRNWGEREPDFREERLDELRESHEMSFFAHSDHLTSSQLQSGKLGSGIFSVLVKKSFSFPMLFDALSFAIRPLLKPRLSLSMLRLCLIVPWPPLH